jgi:hypothetical protein
VEGAFFLPREDVLTKSWWLMLSSSICDSDKRIGFWSEADFNLYLESGSTMQVDDALKQHQLQVFVT